VREFFRTMATIVRKISLTLNKMSYPPMGREGIGVYSLGIVSDRQLAASTIV